MPVPAIIPIGIGAAFVLAGCAKIAKDVRNARPLPSLAGSEWAPKEAGPAEQFVAFKTGGEIVGHGGCNAFFGQYEQSGQTLTIGALASTKKMCRNGMESESRFLQTLQSARRVDATHLSMTLYGADGDALMTLRRRDWD